MSFVGKICPYCKTAIKEEDEVVVCSSCEMPHHKECWIENGGCTTFGCLGTAEGVSPQYDPTIPSYSINYTYCIRCGSQINSPGGVCPICGQYLPTSDLNQRQNVSAYSENSPQYYNGYNNYNNFNSYNNNIQNSYGGIALGQASYGNNQLYIGNQSYISENEVVDFIQVNSDYYISKFNKLKQRDSSANWNWCSFLFSAYWLCYRKMYALGSLFLAVNIAGMFMKEFRGILTLGTSVAMGIAGNYLYMRHVKGKMENIKEMDENSRQKYCASKGGTNPWAVVGCLVISFAVGRIFTL